MEYVTTTFTTEIKITCGCGKQSGSKIIVQDEMSISVIDLALHRLRCWLVEKADWVRIRGKIICSRCESSARDKSRAGWTGGKSK